MHGDGDSSSSRSHRQEFGMVNGNGAAIRQVNIKWLERPRLVHVSQLLNRHQRILPVGNRKATAATVETTSNYFTNSCCQHLTVPTEHAYPYGNSAGIAARRFRRSAMITHLLTQRCQGAEPQRKRVERREQRTGDATDSRLAICTLLSPFPSAWRLYASASLR